MYMYIFPSATILLIKALDPDLTWSRDLSLVVVVVVQKAEVVVQKEELGHQVRLENRTER